MSAAELHGRAEGCRAYLPPLRAVVVRCRRCGRWSQYAARDALTEGAATLAAADGWRELRPTAWGRFSARCHACASVHVAPDASDRYADWVAP